MYQVKELREKRAKLHEDSKGVIELARKEKRELTDEDRSKLDQIDTEIGKLKADIDRMERVEVEERALAESLGRRTDPVIAAQPGAADYDLALRAWALGPKAKPEQIAAAERVGFRWQSPELELRALSIGTTTAGGNSVMDEMMRAWAEIMKWYGRVENLATVVNTTTGAQLPWPTVDDTSNTGRLLTEGTGATTTTDPSFGVVNLSSYKMSSDAVIVSEELLQDSSIPIGPYLGTALGTRVGRIKNTYFTTGSGSSQPGGVQVKASLGKTASATNAITIDEIIDLVHSVDIAYRYSPSSAFMMNDAVAAYVRKLKDSNNQYLWQMAVQQGQPDRLLGFPVVINNDQDSAFSTNKRLVLFGDFSKYVVRNAGAPLFRRSSDVYFLSHQDVFEASQRTDGNLVDTTAVRYLRTA